MKSLRVAAHHAHTLVEAVDEPWLYRTVQSPRRRAALDGGDYRR